MAGKCAICNAEMEKAIKLEVLGKHEAQFQKCHACGLLAAEDPHWLEEAYASPITAQDTGLLERNWSLMRQLCVIIENYFDAKGRYLDYAGGYGITTRLMRNLGLEFYHHDPYCENIFASGYEWDTEFKVDLISSAECMEHVTDPLEFLLKLKQKANAIAITTTLLPEPVPDESWWYYAPQHGQHICFLERRTLEALGKKIKMHVVSYKSMHLFSKSRIETGRFERLMKNTNRPGLFTRKSEYEKSKKRLKRKISMGV